MTEEQKNKILERYLVQVKGAVFVKYAGILKLAHAMGLQTINTDLVQLDLEKPMAIFKATITAKTKDGITSFTGYGDATPKNVSNMVAPHMIRVAETRAKARALRDFVGCKYVSAEELGG
jgi:hypothetical protein